MEVESISGTENKNKPVVVSWGENSEITVEDTRKSPVLQPASDAGQSSAVYDGGDSGQLQRRRASTRLPKDDEIEHLINGAGTQLTGEALIPSLRHDISTVTGTTLHISQEPTQGADADTNGKSLGNQIRASLQTSSGSNLAKFLPIDKLDQIITLEKVYTELAGVLQQERSPDALWNLAHEIWDEVKVPESTSTTRRKIFATLVYIDKAACITYFIEESLYDCHLPFHFPELYHEILVHRKSSQGDDVPVHCFSRMGWSILECENFQQYQWWFQAPYFKIISDGKRERPLHYTFDIRTPLPFIEDDEKEGPGGPRMTSGGYSDVWRVRIHPAHHSHPSLANPLFAVKRLKPNNRNELMFRREVATLKRLSSLDHAHLIKLQVTYLYRDHYHLLFRWADGNLRNYWEAHPKPSDIPRTWEYATWVTSQWLGLARALSAIHDCPPDETIEPEDEQPNDGFGSQRNKGRHGDIKPENILWFQSYEAQDDQPPVNGRLVISDFGLTEFHRDETGLVSPLNIARSPTYRPPEYDVSATISQSYDIWTLGCVLLEFIVWYLQGFEAFDQFSKKRTADDNRDILEDVYFKIVHNFRTKDGEVPRYAAAVFKESVALQIEALRQDSGVTGFIVDALEFIEQLMLRMDPSKRADCDRVVAECERISAKAAVDEKYCVLPVPGRPRRAATDLSVLRSYLFFDPISMQPVPEEEAVQTWISGGDSQKMQLSQNGVSAAVPQQLSVDTADPQNSRTALLGKNKSGHLDTATDGIHEDGRLPVERKKRQRVQRLFRSCFSCLD